MIREVYEADLLFFTFDLGRMFARYLGAFMSNNSKTFRLFISSTFSDFQTERETLQTKIFPELKEYCSSKGYRFQPIDLRWGVSSEAQLDQKALDMCIKEVQSCKTHDYPNFLIMIGDRYGWVPLPNIIEKDEFESILQLQTKQENIELLNFWYQFDKNQEEPSYMLQERKDFTNDNNINTRFRQDYITLNEPENEEIKKWNEAWDEDENYLRDILQEAVKILNINKNINNKEYQKYFTSATESEAIEGIISYFGKTEYQKRLLDLLPELEQLDHKHIFGFFRDIDESTKIKNKFISDDYEKAQEFKDKVKKQLIDENILNVSTAQLPKDKEDKLDESYIDKFITSVTNFLKQQVDKQVSKDSEQNYSDLELEKLHQQFFMNQKLENFLGQEETLKKIENYINDDSDKPLIICGQSGIGKSSIMAKAIENTSNTTDKKIIYRFVGATPNSTTTTDILTSILEELNISIENEQVENKNQFLTDIDKEENPFVNISDKVYDNIMSLTDEIVIFIDAVDQLSNDDQFLWLPNKLPSNIKTIISALKDRDYKEDSKYFYTLEDKISNFIEIEPFNKPIELLESLLQQQNRTLQYEQKEYFLTQYHQVNTPLYVYMAANEIRYWKSSDKAGNDVTLSLSQKDIVKSFMENLTLIHHHEKLLVQKVFGYILASKDGLSEYEILELLNADKEFIKQLAPDTWHKNTTQELPLVIWTRFYNHIKPFLSRKNQDGQELLYFFHREFIDAVQNQSTQQDEHENIIKATQKMIEINQDKEFDSNRWGKLYVSLLLKYYLYYDNEESVKQYYNNVMSKLSINSLIKYFEFITLIKEESKINDNFFAVEHLIKIMIYLTDKFKSLSEEIYFKYIVSLHSQTEILLLNKDYSKVIEIEEKNIVKIESLPTFQKIRKIRKLKETKINVKDIDLEFKWLYIFLEIKEMLGFAYISDKNKIMSIQLTKETHLLLKEFYKRNPKHKTIEILYYDQMIFYAMALQLNSVFFEAIDLLKESLSVLEKYYKEDNKNFQVKGIYAKALYIFSGLSFNVKDKKWHEYFLKSYKIYTELLKYNFLKYSKTIIELNNYFINNYNANNMFLQSEPYYKNNITLLNRQGKKGVEEKITKMLDELKLKSFSLQKDKMLELFFIHKRMIEYVFNFDNEVWAKTYVQGLIMLGHILTVSKIDDENLSIGEQIQKEGVDICEKYMTEEDGWNDLYTKNMNNLANTYTYLNKKEESYTLNIKNLAISSELFQKNQKKWFRAYYYALQNMASTYMYKGLREKEKECREIIKKLEANPQFETIADVIDNKSIDKKIQYFDYIFKASLLIGAYFFVKYVFLE